MLTFIKTARSLVTINAKTASPNENAHTFARLSLIVRTSETTRIENIPNAEEALNAETQSCRDAEF